MRRLISHVFFAGLSMALFSITLSAQAEFRFPGEHRREDPPLGVVEMMQKMRIDKEKKEYDEMIERGEQAFRLATEVGRTFETKSVLTGDELERIETIAKDVKKIRGDLGGGDMDEEDADKNEQVTVEGSLATLRSSTERLLEEIKRSTRFSISVPAIEAANEALKAAKFLLRK